MNELTPRRYYTTVKCQQGGRRRRYLPVPDDCFASAYDIREQLDALRTNIETLTSPHIAQMYCTLTDSEDNRLKR